MTPRGAPRGEVDFFAARFCGVKMNGFGFFPAAAGLLPDEQTG